MTTKELINQYVIAHTGNRRMSASELGALLTEFAEKLMANQPKTREALFREYMQATPAERRKFDLSLLSETRKEALAILTDLGYECKLPQEPASEDLERCVVEQMEADGDVDDFVRRGIDDIASKYAQLGAQWQRDHDQKELQIAEEHGILTGMNMEREKMMKDAEPIRFDCSLPCRAFKNLKAKGIQIGDKLLIIKE